MIEISDVYHEKLAIKYWKIDSEDTWRVFTKNGSYEDLLLDFLGGQLTKIINVTKEN